IALRVGRRKRIVVLRMVRKILQRRFVEVLRISAPYDWQPLRAPGRPSEPQARQKVPWIAVDETRPGQVRYFRRLELHPDERVIIDDRLRRIVPGDQIR